MKIDAEKKLTIIGIGIIFSLIIFFIIYAGFARTLDLTIAKGIDPESEDLTIFFIIIFGIELLALIVSILVSFWQVSKIPDYIVLAAAIVSYLSILVFLFISSYTTLFLTNPELFYPYSGFEFLKIFPGVLIIFSIIIFNHPIYLAVLTIIAYNFIFLLFLERFTERYS
jgi:hypothetical protein